MLEYYISMLSVLFAHPPNTQPTNQPQSKLNNKVSIQSSLKSVTNNNHGSDFAASPKHLEFAKHKIDFGSVKVRVGGDAGFSLCGGQ